jgi:DNA-binding transcriptional MerR regulator
MNFLLAADVAKRLGKTPATIRWYANHGLLPSIRTMNGVRLFTLEDVEVFARKLESKGERVGAIMRHKATPPRFADHRGR